MSDRIPDVHYCRCGSWASFGLKGSNGVTLWTCGMNGCVKADETGKEQSQ